MTRFIVDVVTCHDDSRWSLPESLAQRPSPPNTQTRTAKHRRFSLGDVQLPSDHWEWVGGWIPDAEGEVCADEDGWIYGSTPAEILEISETASERRPSGGTAVTAGQGPHKGDAESRRNPGDWSLRGPGGKGNAGVDMPVRGGGVKDERSGSGSTDVLGAVVLRRRRLVRLRTVVRLDGARESTKNFLKTMQRWVGILG